MGVFEAIASDTHEEVLYGYDPVSGLKTIIAIHSTALGPALGGTRFFPYETEAEALRDALRLAKGMSFKSAAAGLDLGGGKAVIIGDPSVIKTERLLRAYARVVDSLGGRYITAEDVGASAEDMITIATETRWVTGLPDTNGGSGDPSPATARGVIGAMRAVAERLWGSGDLADRTVAVQGVGKVGSSLVERLTKAGAKTVISDVNGAALHEISSEFGSVIVGTDEIFDVDCDIFAPCAMGGAINEETAGRLRCQAVVGSANNQLENGMAQADQMAARDILYAPDFIVNAGGIINIADELRGSYDWRRAAQAVDQIPKNLRKVFDKADERGITPHVAAIEVAEERIADIGSINLKRRGHQS
ncbi:MAG: Glu/Leu/Phe/Val dehydrogenase [Acidimicrobiia bacterium]|nr:Glu/Leu/Phe/Val dehydrogenase [Acidimicrobiia bacterium]